MVISLQQHRDVTEQTYQHRPIGLAFCGIAEKIKEKIVIILKYRVLKDGLGTF